MSFLLRFVLLLFKYTLPQFELIIDILMLVIDFRGGVIIKVDFDKWYKGTLVMARSQRKPIYFYILRTNVS